MSADEFGLIALTLGVFVTAVHALGSIAEAGIINATFYTTLVLSAILTSQIAGTWLLRARQGLPAAVDRPGRNMAHGENRRVGQPAALTAQE